MAAKVGVKPEEYAAAMPGTYFLSLAEAKKRFEKGDGAGFAVRLDQDRRRVQRRQQGLQGQPQAGRRLHLPRPDQRAVGAVAMQPARWLAHPATGAGPSPARAADRRPRSCCRCCCGAALSYLPFLWHPFVEITDPGGLTDYPAGTLLDRTRGRSQAENARARAEGKRARQRRRRPTRSTCPPRTQVAAGAVHRLPHPAAAARRALAAPEPVAQPAGDLLGLPALVAGRRAAGDPVRHLPRLCPG